MAGTSRQKRSTTILGVLQFLSLVHTWVHTSSQAADRVNRKEGVEVARRREEHLQ